MTIPITWLKLNLEKMVMEEELLPAILLVEMPINNLPEKILCQK